MAHPDYRPRRKRKKSWLGRILFWSAGTVIVLVVAAVIATPWILRTAVPEIFARIGMQATVTGGDLSLSRREITLTGLTVGAPDAPALSLGELGVGLGLRALTEGRIRLRHLRVKNVSINAERLLALRELGDTGTGSAQGRLPVELDKLELEDVRLVSLGERIGHDVRVARLSISDLSALLADKKSNVDLQGAIGEGSVNLQLEVGLDKGNVRATGKFHADKLPVRGWAALAAQVIDPVSSGSVDGRGDIQIDYGLEAKSLDLSLEGRLSLAGLGMNVETLRAERGDADWRGRLALRWAPNLATPKLRGDGRLDVESLHLNISQPSQAPVRAAISDLSWHGEFDWQNGFTSDGAVLGTGVEVSDASSTQPAWHVRAEDFSWRLHARIDSDSDQFAGRIQDFDLAHLSLTVTDAHTPIEIAADKVAVDEVRAAQSGDLVLGSATVDTLTVAETVGANSTDGLTLRAGGLVAKGLSGDFSGKLQGAHVSAESLDFAESGRRLRAEDIDFASVGFRVPAWVGFDELNVKSVRADEGRGDIWLSGLKASKVHGEAGGRFGAEAVHITHIFQSGSSELSWDVADLKVRGVRGDTFDAAHVSAIDLGAVKIGIDESTWESSGLKAADVAVTRTGNLNVAHLAAAKLERRQPSAGDLGIVALDARGFRLLDEHAVLDGVTAATLEYRLHGGDAFQAHGLKARALGGDRANGLEVSRFSVAGGSGHLLSGTRLSAAALTSRGLVVASNGDVTIEHAELQRFTHSGADSAIVDLERLTIATSRWAPGGQVSIDKAALSTAAFARADGVSWRFADLDVGALDWDQGEHINVQRATLASASQRHGQSRDWQAQGLRATGLRLALPGDVEVAALSARSVDGGAGSPAWKVISVKASGLGSSDADGQKVDMLESGAVTVTDARNGAALEIERAAIEAAKVSALNELSAEDLLVDDLRVHSDKPDWPARLRVAQLRVAAPRLGLDGAVDLGPVVARNPYLIVAQTEDNTWMWPPLPGGGGGEKDADKSGSSGAIRVASFITRGTGRLAYIDRATEPAVHVIIDPVAVALLNLDTRLPGNVSHFRARGTGSRYAGLRMHGELRSRIEGFDLELKLNILGADLPPLSPYSARYEALAVTAGRADTHNDIVIENDALSGKVDVLLSGLEVTSVMDDKTLQLIDPATFPLRTALALLKDRQGNISLTIPLQARTDDPRYDFVDEFQTDFVRTVTTAGKVAANLPGKTLDTALRLLERTVSLLPGVSAERYPPVAFAYGADNFTAAPLVYLDQIGKRMREHEALVLALCGRSVSGDDPTASGRSSNIDTLFAEASKGVYRDYAPGRDGLLALAEARAGIVRRYLHDVHQIPERRLHPCDAHVDATSGAKPRVDIQVKVPAEGKGLFGSFF